ncbi:MAG: low temperature requirement protein A [Actinobacteria bacterium]|nr:low temperature requirement protein A [Actinomycetota bacterium]
MNQSSEKGGDTDRGPRPASRRRQAWSTPRLRVGQGEERRATWLELFFDLVFVVAIAALAVFLHDHLTLGGFLGFALLLVPVGWAWMSFAYYADQFDTDDTLFRVVMLVAMLASAALAVNVGGALEGSPAGFVVANVVLRALLIGLYAWAWSNATEARPMSARYAVGFSVGALIWLSSLLAPEPLRYGLWALALLVEMGTPVLGYSTVRSVPGHVSHMPERFGLFTLIVLGESIVVLTSGVVDTSWRPVSALTAVGGFTVAACLWWLYFDHVDEEAIGQSFTSGVAGVVRSHVWGYGHLTVWAGIATASVGIEFAISEASEPELSAAIRWSMWGGISLYLLAISAIQLATPTSLRTDVVALRLGVTIVVAALAPLGVYLNPLVLVGLLALLLVGLTAFEVSRSERPPAGPPPRGCTSRRRGGASGRGSGLVVSGARS